MNCCQLHKVPCQLERSKLFTKSWYIIIPKCAAVEDYGTCCFLVIFYWPLTSYSNSYHSKFNGNIILIFIIMVARFLILTANIVLIKTYPGILTSGVNWCEFSMVIYLIPCKQQDYWRCMLTVYYILKGDLHVA